MMELDTAGICSEKCAAAVTTMPASDGFKITELLCSSGVSDNARHQAPSQAGNATTTREPRRVIRKKPLVKHRHFHLNPGRQPLPARRVTDKMSTLLHC